MPSAHPARLYGLVSVAIALAALLAVSAWLGSIALQAAHALAGGAPPSLDRLLDLTLAGLGTPVALWLAASVGVSSWRVLRGLPRGRFTPAVVHRLVALTLGTALAAVPMAAQATPQATTATVQTQTRADPSWAGQATPAGDPSSSATPSSSAPPSSSATPSSSAPAPNTAPAPGWTPDESTLPPPRAKPAEPAVVGNPRPAAESGTVVVHKGDTLWEIASRHLGADATPVEIAAAWPQWWNANRDVIGANPDLIQPGQQLRVPLT